MFTGDGNLLLGLDKATILHQIEELVSNSMVVDGPIDQRLNARCY